MESAPVVITCDDIRSRMNDDSIALWIRNILFECRCWSAMQETNIRHRRATTTMIIIPTITRGVNKH